MASRGRQAAGGRLRAGGCGQQAAAVCGARFAEGGGRCAKGD
ncbi:MAG: hypothetical protein E6Y08_03580 [Paenibacillus sp.]|nr:hypothetical protein [Paenibacillus sp.]MDU4694872.1 hypothetical protein [Paenibacillus sp.]